MIRNVLTHISGIGLYGIVSICLFFALFLGTLIWVGRLKRPYLETMRELPLQDDRADPAPAQPDSRHD